MSEDDKMKYFIEEWKVTISTQMHFNDLLIRYRQIFITLFATIITASTTLRMNDKIQPTTMLVITIAVLTSWLVSYLLDFWYYHQLLQAAVNHAKKFDENKTLREMGFFGLTETLNNKVPKGESGFIVHLFYLIPALAAVIATSISWSH
jgi:hypothetical protein